jgi:hypothetical protein
VCHTLGAFVGVIMGASPDSIRCVGENDFLVAASVPRSTWQNWIRQQLLEPSTDGVYDERAVVELVVAAELVAALTLPSARSCWNAARHRLLPSLLNVPLEYSAQLDLVVSPHDLIAELASSPEELAAHVGSPRYLTRHVVVIPLAPLIVEARRAFWIRARPASDLLRDRRRRGHQGRAPSSDVNPARSTR